MGRIGIISPPTLGHVNPFLILGQELLTKGHSVVFFQLAEMKERIVNAGIEFYEIGKLIPNHSMKGIQKELGQRHGLEAMRYWRKRQIGLFKVWFNDLPDAIEKSNIDLMLVDQSDPVGACIAEAKNIPFITVALGLDLDWEENIPPFFSNWSYAVNPMIIHRNTIAMQEFVEDFESLFTYINGKRAELGIPEYDFYKSLYPVSTIAQIAQLPKFLDYPRDKKPLYFHNVGPFISEYPSKISFPFEQVNGKPLVYISLGTILNVRPDIFNLVGSSFKGMEVQLVISLGNKEVILDQSILPPDTIVVDYAPQREVLALAKLCVSHGGLNTVMDALSKGVPVLVVPISFDQPGTAARVKYAKVGDYIQYRSLSEETLKRQIVKIMSNKDYYENANTMKLRFAEMTGTQSAIKIIEQTLEEYV